jgi:hypothetical protein
MTTITIHTFILATFTAVWFTGRDAFGRVLLGPDNVVVPGQSVVEMPSDDIAWVSQDERLSYLFELPDDADMIPCSVSVSGSLWTQLSNQTRVWLGGSAFNKSIVSVSTDSAGALTLDVNTTLLAVWMNPLLRQYDVVSNAALDHFTVTYAVQLRSGSDASLTLWNHVDVGSVDSVVARLAIADHLVRRLNTSTSAAWVTIIWVMGAVAVVGLILLSLPSKSTPEVVNEAVTQEMQHKIGDVATKATQKLQDDMKNPLSDDKLMQAKPDEDSVRLYLMTPTRRLRKAKRVM